MHDRGVSMGENVHEPQSVRRGHGVAMLVVVMVGGMTSILDLSRWPDGLTYGLVVGWVAFIVSGLRLRGLALKLGVSLLSWLRL